MPIYPIVPAYFRSIPLTAIFLQTSLAIVQPWVSRRWAQVVLRVRPVLARLPRARAALARPVRHAAQARLGAVRLPLQPEAGVELAGLLAVLLALALRAVLRALRELSGLVRSILSASVGGEGQSLCRLFCAVFEPHWCSGVSP